MLILNNEDKSVVAYLNIVCPLYCGLTVENYNQSGGCVASDLNRMLPLQKSSLQKL
jgi:hypothetical protein